jgi:hypothetical protein
VIFAEPAKRCWLAWELAKTYVHSFNHMAYQVFKSDTTTNTITSTKSKQYLRPGMRGLMS